MAIVTSTPRTINRLTSLAFFIPNPFLDLPQWECPAVAPYAVRSSRNHSEG